MFNLYIFLLLIYCTLNYSKDNISAKTKSILHLKDLKTKKILELINHDNEEKKQIIGKFSKSKIDGNEFDSADIRIEFNSFNEKTEYKLSSYLITPISKKLIRETNEFLIWKNHSSVAIDLTNSLDLINNLDSKLIWKNLITYKNDLSKSETRTIYLNKQKLRNNFASLTQSQLEEIYKLVNSFSNQMHINYNNSIIFNTAFNLKSTIWNIEFGYNFTFKEKEKIEFSEFNFSKFETFKIKTIIPESTDLKHYKYFFDDNNHEITINDLDFDSIDNINSICSKFYCNYSYDLLFFGSLLNLNLNLSYSLMTNKDHDLNLLGTLSYIF